LLIARTEGNPFFLEESVRALVELKFLDGERGAYRLVKAVESLRIPASAQAILTARIDRLAPQDKRVLQAAAVIGKEVPFALLAAICEESEENLRASLSQLQAAEYLYETTLFPNLEFTFRHALTQVVAYDSLLQERRHRLHAAIVEAIERLYPDRLAERVEWLAYHAMRGEVWDKVLTYARQAGAKSLARSANQEAVAFFERALNALRKLQQDWHSRELAIDLRFDLRSALMQLGEFARTLDLLREVEAIAGELGDRRRLGWCTAYMTNVFWEMGEQDRAVASGLRALDIAVTLEDNPIRDAARRYLGRSYHAMGDYRQAIIVLTEIVDPPAHDATTSPGSAAGVLTRCFLTLCLAEVGAFVDAAAYGREALRTA
jgi:tetratricopeptide (TPR) repeat protein